LPPAPEEVSEGVPESVEQPMIIHAEATKVARCAVVVLGNLRISMLVSIGY
jgi:hypothetical protein